MNTHRHAGVLSKDTHVQRIDWSSLSVEKKENSMMTNDWHDIMYITHTKTTRLAKTSLAKNL